MANIIVVGAQWGDEGKGKIVDLLTEHASVVARFQGGHNAGHTVVIGDEQFILHLIPSGILHDRKVCLIGNGVVVDPAALIEEIDALKERGLNVNGRLFVSDNAHLIMPYHVAIDKGSEQSKGKERIGTTGRGIGPCYVDKMARTGIRVGDLLRPEAFRNNLERNLKNINLLMQHIYQSEPFDTDEIFSAYMSYAEQLRPFIQDTEYLVSSYLDEGKNILLEGAQGTLLDVDHGTYPFVTSSSPTAGGACAGLGIGPTRINGVLGIIKAYTTRVGEGPFPTEQNNKLGENLRAKGGEYGATTGRPRRCGWFDGVAARYAVRINGLTGLALTKLDVLDDMEEIKVCTGYTLKGKKIVSVPHDSSDIDAIEPIYDTLPGWRESTVGITKFEDLPGNAKSYISYIENLAGTPVDMVSTGQKRDEIIIRKNPFKLF